MRSFSRFLQQISSDADRSLALGRISRVAHVHRLSRLLSVDTSLALYQSPDPCLCNIPACLLCPTLTMLRMQETWFSSAFVVLDTPYSITHSGNSPFSFSFVIKSRLTPYT